MAFRLFHLDDRPAPRSPACTIASARLVVEEEERFAAGLRCGLEAEGFAVDVALDGVDRLDGARERLRCDRPAQLAANAALT